MFMEEQALNLLLFHLNGLMLVILVLSPCGHSLSLEITIMHVSHSQLMLKDRAAMTSARPCPNIICTVCAYWGSLSLHLVDLLLKTAGDLLSA